MRPEVGLRIEHVLRVTIGSSNCHRIPKNGLGGVLRKHSLGVPAAHRLT